VDHLSRRRGPPGVRGPQVKNRCSSPLKPKLAWIIFNDSVRTAKKTQHFTITKINWLTLFKEIIAVYIENHMKHINKNAELLIVKASGTYNHH
jgi:hypothetical protein